MGRDRSLDEFVGSESGDSTASEENSDGEGVPTDPEAGTDGSTPEPEPGVDDADEAGTAATEPPAEVEPPTVTYRWDPEGVQCADCGATVGILWSGEAGQVCAECKEW